MDTSGKFTIEEIHGKKYATLLRDACLNQQTGIEEKN